jgi:heptosyltransferase-2
VSRPAPQRILCVAPHWVGDSLFFLPAVDALKRLYPDAQIDALAKVGIASLLKDSGRFGTVHSLPPGATRLQRFAAHWGLRRQRYDLAVVFPDSFSSALAAWLSGAKRRVGRSGEGRDWLLSWGGVLPPRQRQQHVVDEYLELAERCGANAGPAERQPKLALPAVGVEERQRLFRESKFESGLRVGLCPTSAYGPAKMWPAEHWIALARQLSALRYQVAFFCAPGELEAVGPMARAAGGLPVLAPSLPGLAACLAACEAVIANDSGPLHLAAAVGTRALGLYGPVDPKWSAPRSPRAEALYHGLECSPCHARVCPLGHHNCLKGMEVAEVLTAFQGLLKR